ncbi:hypothetical protein K0B04_00585 [Patescibacteria group bacterium]|nr:hypothetical protein [Patescibacteria group bacterium]
MNKKLIVLGSAGLLLGAIFIVPSKVLAYRGDASVKGPDCTEERHEKMVAAFDNNDYQSWKELMNGKGRVTEVINEENFSKFGEAHRLSLEGKTEEAQQIREELGLGLRNGTGSGRRMGGGFGRNSK